MKLTRLQRAAFVLGVLALLAVSFPSRTDLGWSFIATRDYARAVAVLEPLTKRGNVSRDTWEALAAAWAGLGFPERQITALEAAAGATPGDRELMLRLTDVYEAAKDIEGAARTLDRLVAARPEDDASLQRLLGLYDWLGRYADASRILSKILARDIRRPDLAQDAMNMARMLDRADDAIPVLERWAAARGEDAEAHRQLAQFFDAIGREEQARARWRMVARLAPNDAEARERLAAAAPPAEPPAGATARATPPAPVDDPIKAAEALARRAPDDPARLRAVAEAYVGADRAREALPWQERLVAITDSDTDWRRLIELYEWTAQPTLALGARERFAARRPDDRQVVEQLVESLVANERVPDAIPWQRRLVERAPADVPAALRLAQLHEWAGQEKEAIAVYERLDKANRLPAAMLARLGDLYRFQDRPADFLRVAERGLAATPDDEPLRLLAVEAAEGLDRPAQAAALLRPLVDARPRDLTLVARYVGLAIRGQRLEDALAVHRRVAAAAGVEYRMTVARAFGDAGRGAEAAAEYDAVLGLAAGDTRVLREVGRRALELSRNDVSLKAWRGLLARAPDDPEGLKRAGQILAWNNDNRAAQAAFERFNRVRGGDYEVHFLLGELYTFMRDEARAREQYERALRLLPRRSQLR